MEKFVGNGDGPFRSEFRVPVHKDDGIRMNIEGREYVVENLASRGVQLSYSDDADFQEGADISQAILILAEREIHVGAKVIYTTRIERELYTCGLYFFYIAPDDLDFVRDVVSRKRRELFSE